MTFIWCNARREGNYVILSVLMGAFLLIISTNSISNAVTHLEPTNIHGDLNDTAVTNLDSYRGRADFNGDGFDDLAVGAPDHDMDRNNDSINDVFDVGSVNVIYGSSRGLNTTALSASEGRDDQIWTRPHLSRFWVPETGDRFGHALAVGDFNNDTYSDLAIGVPGERINYKDSAGAVYIIYGSSRGLNNTAVSATDGGSYQYWSEGHANNVYIRETFETGDRFGHALTTGDFNADGFSDLAIGVPGESVATSNSNVNQAGSVIVLYGTSDGLSMGSNGLCQPTTPRCSQMWSQTATGGVETADWFGSALTTGDFNADGFSDLAVGISNDDLSVISDPGDVNVSVISDAGAVNVIYGSATGLSSWIKKIDVWTQNSKGIEGSPETGDRFGHALAAGDFNRDRYTDLAIGTWEEQLYTVKYAGVVNVIYGSSLGLNGTTVSNGNGRSAQLWTQDSPGIQDNSEAGDRFGGALTTGDFDGDATSDLAIGAWTEDVANIDDAGITNVIYGSSIGLYAYQVTLGDGVPNQIWTQDTQEVEGLAEAGDWFASALITGDFDGNGISDLVVGVPADSVGNTQIDAGAINVIYGSMGTSMMRGGLSATVPTGSISSLDQIWTQDSPDIEGEAELAAHFGASVR